MFGSEKNVKVFWTAYKDCKWGTVKPLGIIVKNNKIVNHRPLLKIVLNPMLRVFGFYIGSRFNTIEVGDRDTVDFGGYKFFKGEVRLNIIKNYQDSLCTCNDYDKVIRKRWII